MKEKKIYTEKYISSVDAVRMGVGPKLLEIDCHQIG